MSAGPQDVHALVKAFVSATGDETEHRFTELVETAWQDGRATPASTEVVDEVVRVLWGADTRHQGLLVVLLGLLAGSDDGLRTTLREHLDPFLDLLAGTGGDRPLTLALFYLLGHFPEHRERIMAAVRELDPPEDDRTRLERSLRRLDPEEAVIGRVWPSPSAWPLSDDEIRADRAWVSELSADQLSLAWDRDTRSVRSHTGAKALWAVREGMPVTVEDRSRHAEDPVFEVSSLKERRPGGHSASLRCTSCRGSLVTVGTTSTCQGCSLTYPVDHGVVDLLNPSAPKEGSAGDALQQAQVMPRVGGHYENGLRPAFLRSMGSNWGGQVTPSDEDAYLARHLAPAKGPVLDLAAGGGRWTAVVADTVGAERVTALDANPSMLLWLRGRLPQVEAVRASALDLPFDDASLGAVNCWNSLQALPDPGLAIREVGRCLRPGGLLTLLTFLRSPDPVYRHFQTTQNFPGFPDGMPLFERDEILAWLRTSGLSVRDEWAPGTFFVITAEKVG